MKINERIVFNWRLMIIRFSVIVLLFINFSSYAQRKLPLIGIEKPPRPITLYVNPAQGLSFGAFYEGTSGGTIIVNANGSRSTTGTVIGVNLGFSYSPAIFQVDAEPGTLITISNGPDINLTGSNGGTMSLHIGSSDLGSPFTATAVSPSRTQLRIGATLTVGTPIANPPGNYSGTFSVTFIQQ